MKTKANGNITSLNPRIDMSTKAKAGPRFFLERKVIDCRSHGGPFFRATQDFLQSRRSTVMISLTFPWPQAPPFLALDYVRLTLHDEGEPPLNFATHPVY